MSDHLGHTDPSVREPLSVTILRERGAMDLREVTAATARRMGWTLMYDDVDAVLRAAMERGQVRITNTRPDYRDLIWEAI